MFLSSFSIDVNFLDWSKDEWFSFGIAVGVVVVGIVLLLLLTKSRHTTRSLVYAAVSVSMAFVLNLIKTPSLLYGGSVTLFRFLPLVVYACMFGTLKGISAGAVYGVSDLLMSGWVVHPIQVLLDYIFGFACVGLAGVFRNKKLYYIFGPLLAALGRYVCLVISGVVFWGSGMFDYGFSNVWVYSLAYNSISLIDMALVIVALAILNNLTSFRQLLRRGDDLPDKSVAENQ